MTYTNTHKITIAWCSIALLCLAGCGKSTEMGKTTTPPAKKTDAQLLESAPWKISFVDFLDAITGIPYGTPMPDSLKNLVLTFNSDNTFTETGGKTASGTWVLVPQQEHVITLTTSTSPASAIDWRYGVMATTLGLTNTFIDVTFINPEKTYEPYVGEELGFNH